MGRKLEISEPHGGKQTGFVENFHVPAEIFPAKISIHGL